jgi:WD40 repeat protein
VYLWDLTSTNPPVALAGHTGPVIAAQFSEDGNWLATAAWDGTFRLWDPVARREILHFPLSNACFRKSKDDRWWGHWVGGTRLGIWEVATERELRLLRKELATGVTAVRAEISPAGDLHAVAYTDGVRIWNLRSGAEMAFLPLGWTSDLKLTGPGSTLLTCSEAGLQEWPLVLSNDHKTLTPGESRLLSAPGKAVEVSIGKDDELFYLQGGKVHLINRSTLEEKAQIKANFAVTQITTSPDGNLLVAWGRPALEFRVWETASQLFVKSLPGNGGGVAVFSPNGRWLAIGDRRGYYIVEVGSWKTLFAKRTDIDFQVFNFAFSPDNRILAVSHDPAEVWLFDTATWKAIARLEPPDERPVVSLNFGPDGTQLIATCSREVIQIWDLALIRSELSAMHLDWDLPPYPSVENSRSSTHGGVARNLTGH